ncbi:MAG: T9SS type A sorting domain-containing protein [Candidatus Kapabacteria bacterium]|nr:T9SS type A sorting domain-containing protein [Candidatus Kapabacteria bacterium]
MKTLVLFAFFLTTSILAQKLDSIRIGSNSALVVKGNKVLTLGKPNEFSEYNTFLYSENVWKNISQDTMPTIHLHNSRCTFSKFSDHLFVSGQFHLWEFDGKDWLKHAIYDSLYHRRRFQGMIELPDSSLLITAFTEFIIGSIGNHTSIGKIFHEVLKFKHGTFSTVKSRWTTPNDGIFEMYQQMKLHKNGTYSMFTMDESDDNNTWELVTYSSENGNIVRKDIFPNLEPFGFKNHKVEFHDYLFDSKGSLWYLTRSEDEIAYDANGNMILDPDGYPTTTINFVGLVEVTKDKVIRFYNDNIGIQKSDLRPRSFTIDDEDNIWFYYNYRSNMATIFPSIYKLHSDRKTLTEYKQETMLQYSTMYNGGNTNHNFYGKEYSLLVYNDSTKSLFICGGGTPLLQFFPEQVPTSVWDRQLSTVELYPNPVPNGKNVEIVSTSLSNNSQISIVIRDISGKVVHEVSLNSISNNISINTDGLIRGSYFISVLQNNNVILQTSFVKE